MVKGLGLTLEKDTLSLSKSQNGGIVDSIDTENQETILEARAYLFKYRFCYKGKTFVLYNYFVFEEVYLDYAVSENNRLLFFTKKDQRSAWLRTGLNAKYSIPRDIFLTCDYVKVVDIFNTADIDAKNYIIHFVDTFWDLLRSIGLDFPKRYDRLVSAIIDHFTWNKTVTMFFKRFTYTLKFVLTAMFKIQEIILQNAVVYNAETDSCIDMMEYLDSL